MTKTPNIKIQKRDLKVGKNAGIIDQILFLEEGEFDEASLKQNFIKLWKEREEIFIMKEEVKLPDNVILRFIIGVEGWSFEVIKDDEVLGELLIVVTVFLVMEVFFLERRKSLLLILKKIIILMRLLKKFPKKAG